MFKSRQFAHLVYGHNAYALLRALLLEIRHQGPVLWIPTHNWQQAGGTRSVYQQPMSEMEHQLWQYLGNQYGIATIKNMSTMLRPAPYLLRVLETDVVLGRDWEQNFCELARKFPDLDSADHILTTHASELSAEMQALLHRWLELVVEDNAAILSVKSVLKKREFPWLTKLYTHWWECYQQECRDKNLLQKNLMTHLVLVGQFYWLQRHSKATTQLQFFYLLLQLCGPCWQMNEDLMVDQLLTEEVTSTLDVALNPIESWSLGARRSRAFPHRLQLAGRGGTVEFKNLLAVETLPLSFERRQLNPARGERLKCLTIRLKLEWGARVVGQTRRSWPWPAPALLVAPAEAALTTTPAWQWEIGESDGDGPVQLTLFTSLMAAERSPTLEERIAQLSREFAQMLGAVRCCEVGRQWHESLVITTHALDRPGLKSGWKKVLFSKAPFALLRGELDQNGRRVATSWQLKYNGPLRNYLPGRLGQMIELIHI